MNKMLRFMQKFLGKRSNSIELQQHHKRPWKSLYFHHIGKTGGISFAEMLASTIGKDRTYPNWGVSSDLLRDKSQYVLFAGHFPFDVAVLLPQPVTVVTTVREPLEHILSIYNHLRRSDGKHLILAHRTKPLTTFDDFLRDPVLAHITTNPQTHSLGRQIAREEILGCARRIQAVDWLETGSRDDFWCLYGSRDEDRNDHALLEKACWRVAQPWVFAYLCEDMSADLSNIFSDLHLQPPKEFLDSPLRINAKPSDPSMLARDDLSELQVAEIFLRTQLDHKLYEYVRRSRVEFS